MIRYNLLPTAQPDNLNALDHRGKCFLRSDSIRVCNQSNGRGLSRVALISPSMCLPSDYFQLCATKVVPTMINAMPAMRSGDVISERSTILQSSLVQNRDRQTDRLVELDTPRAVNQMSVPTPYNPRPRHTPGVSRNATGPRSARVPSFNSDETPNLKAIWANAERVTLNKISDRTNQGTCALPAVHMQRAYKPLQEGCPPRPTRTRKPR